jgi:hypothetical protein
VHSADRAIEGKQILPSDVAMESLIADDLLRVPSMARTAVHLCTSWKNQGALF